VSFLFSSVNERERNIPMRGLIPRGNGGEKEQRRETSVSVKSIGVRSLSLWSLSLSLSFLALKRAFLSSKVALSENLSQIDFHPNCRRKTRERERGRERRERKQKHARAKKKAHTPRHRQRERHLFKRERERERNQRSKKRAKKQGEELFFYFFGSFSSLSRSFVFFLSNSFDEKSRFYCSSNTRRTPLFSRALVLASHQSLGFVAQNTKIVWDF